MPFDFLGIGTAVGGVLGGLFGDDGGQDEANAFNLQLLNEGRFAIKQATLRQRLFNQQAFNLLDNRVQAVLGTFDQGIEQAQNIGHAGRQEIRRQGTQASAAAEQASQARGFAPDSSVAAASQGQVAGNTQVALGRSFAQEASLLSQLYGQRAGLQSSLLGSLAQQSNLQGAGELQSAQMLLGFLPQFAAQPGQPSDNGLGAFGGLLGGIADGIFG